MLWHDGLPHDTCVVRKDRIGSSYLLDPVLIGCTSTRGTPPRIRTTDACTADILSDDWGVFRHTTAYR